MLVLHDNWFGVGSKTFVALPFIFCLTSMQTYQLVLNYIYIQSIVYVIASKMFTTGSWSSNPPLVGRIFNIASPFPNPRANMQTDSDCHRRWPHFLSSVSSQRQCINQLQCLKSMLCPISFVNSFGSLR